MSIEFSRIIIRTTIARLDEDIDAIDSDVARLRMRLFAIVLDHKIYAATVPSAVMFNRQTRDNFAPRREHSPLHSYGKACA